MNGVTRIKENFMNFPALPEGFRTIAGGTFCNKLIEIFGFKETPVTNAEWRQDVRRMLGQDRFVLLHHDWNTGETRMEKRGKSVEEVVGGLASVPYGMNFDRGDVLILGSQILLKMVDQPSAKYDETGRVFSGDKQPVVGISYFHAKSWCLLKTEENEGWVKYDLPTDLQYAYVASNKGRNQYGTEAGTLFQGKKKLAHAHEFQDGRGTTVDVDDPRYIQSLPFGVQTTGNIFRWIRARPKSKKSDDNSPVLYRVRGGSWFDVPDRARASLRWHYGLRPRYRGNNVGFSPVVVL